MLNRIDADLRQTAGGVRVWGATWPLIAVLFVITSSATGRAQSSPPYYIAGVVNAADYKPATTVAPREDLAVFGNFLVRDAYAADPTKDLPTTLGGVKVSFARAGTLEFAYGRVAYVSRHQINVVVPESIPHDTSGITQMVVEDNGGPLFDNVIPMFVGIAPALWPVASEALTPCGETCREDRLLLRLWGTGAGGTVLADGYEAGQFVGRDEILPVDIDGAEVFLDGRTIGLAAVRLAPGNMGAELYEVRLDARAASIATPSIHLVQVRIGRSYTAVVVIELLSHHPLY